MTTKIYNFAENQIDILGLYTFICQFFKLKINYPILQVKPYFKQILQLVYMLTIVSLLFAAGRFVMFLSNSDVFAEFALKDIFWAIVNGLVYDIYTVILINSLFIALFFAPVKIYNSLFYQFILRLLFISVNTFAIFVNLIDVAVYKCYFHRLRPLDYIQNINTLLVDLQDDSKSNFINEYLSLILYFIAFIVILFLLMRFIKMRKLENRNINITLKLTSLISLLLAGVLFYFATMYKSINLLTDIYLKGDRKLAPLIVNNPYFLITTSLHHNETIKLNDDWNIEKYTSKKQYQNTKNIGNYKHIKLVISYNLPNNNIPYKTDSKMFMHDINIDNTFGLLDEILFSYPGLFKGGMYNSLYSLNKMESLIDILHKKSYCTQLSTYGYSPKTTKLINNFYRFDNYADTDSSKTFELILIKKQAQFDSIQQQLKKALNKQDNLLVIKVLPALEPSENMKDILPKGISFDSKKKLSFYAPKDSVIAQYLDIKPSILQLIGYNKEFISYGSSLFSSSYCKCKLLTTSDTSYSILSDSLLLNFSKDSTISMLKVKNFKLSDYDFKDSLAVERIVLENKLQSMLYDLRKRFINNELMVND